MVFLASKFKNMFKVLSEFFFSQKKYLQNLHLIKIVFFWIQNKRQIKLALLCPRFFLILSEKRF